MNSAAPALRHDPGTPLPPLRDDLSLLKGPVQADGSPTWSIFDPVRHRYFRVGWPAFQLLSRWSAGNRETLVEQVCAQTTYHATAEDVDALVRFLFANSLTRDPPSGNSDQYVSQWTAQRRGLWTRLVHSYLFLRLPLVRPDRFLRATLPVAELFYTRAFRNVALLLGLVGLYLAMRQWDQFVSTFAHFFNPAGIVAFLAGLSVVKVLHELGHAYTATRYGCRVPSMGVALLVMFPVLYTDATDAWRLPGRGQRAHIAAAGMLTELYVALLATFAWSFLPDGPARSVAFVLATTSWTLSLAININAFMRFDGYYILSDWLGIENLYASANSMGRWRLRELLFSLGAPPPAAYTTGLRRFLIAYGWCAWVYRFVLFLSIAVLVYNVFFKALGILLFGVEIIWLIVMPIAREFREWWRMRARIMAAPRTRWTTAVVLAGVALFAVPWSSRVSIPAVVQAFDEATVFAPAPARIGEVLVQDGQLVGAGDGLLVLESPHVANEIRRTRLEAERIALRLQRSPGNPEDRAELGVLAQQLERLEAQLDGLKALTAKLTVRAPRAGKAVDLASDLHPGRWIDERLALATIVEPDAMRIAGMLAESELTRVAVEQTGRFLPDDPDQPAISVQVVEISDAAVRDLDLLQLGSLHGGPVAVRQDPNSGALVPEASVYRVVLEPVDAQMAPATEQRGVVHVEGVRRSLARRMYEQIAAVLVRESGF